MLSLLMKTFEQIKEMGNKFKMCITYSKCGEQIQNEENKFKTNKFKMWRTYSKFEIILTRNLHKSISYPIYY